MLEVKINITGMTHELDAIRRRLENPTQLMDSIAAELVSEAEHQLENESGPAGKWPDLKVSTIERRRKTKNWPGKMLQVSGGLASSIQGFHDSHMAGVRAGSGPSKNYAAIHQFGGKAGRGHKTTIPARPFLPIRGMPGSGDLSDQAKKAVGGIVEDYLKVILNRVR